MIFHFCLVFDTFVYDMQCLKSLFDMRSLGHKQITDNGKIVFHLDNFIALSFICAHVSSSILMPLRFKK